MYKDIITIIQMQIVHTSDTVPKIEKENKATTFINIIVLDTIPTELILTIDLSAHLVFHQTTVF